MFLAFVLVFAATSLVLSIPAVQNRLVPTVNRQVSQALGTSFSVQSVNIGFPDRVLLYGVELDDTRGKPLLYARAIKVGAVSFPLLRWLAGSRKRPLAARSVELDGPFLNLYISRADSTLNLDFLFASDPNAPDDTTASRPILLEFESISARELRFDFVDSTLADTLLRPTPGQLNYGYLQVEDLSLETSLSLQTDGPLRAYLAQLALTECHSGLRIQELRTDFQMHLGHEVLQTRNLSDSIPHAYIKFLRTYLVQDSTRLDGDFTFDNEAFDQFFEPGPTKRYELTFRPSRLDFRTLGFFIGELPLGGLATVSGQLRGDPRRLRARDLELGLGQHTRLVTDLRLTNYQTDSLYLEVDFDHSKVNLAEVDTLLTTVELPTELHRLGTTDIHGDFIGFIDDFVADADLSSRFGRLSTNLQIQLPPSPAPMAYRGHLRTDSLNLDTLLGATVSKNFNIECFLQGKGTDLPSLNTTFDYTLRPSDVAGYALDSSRGHLTVKNQVVEGSADVLDREGDFHATLAIDAAGPQVTYNLVGDLQRLDLAHYGATEQPIRLSTVFNVDLAGDSLENTTGRMRMLQLRLENPVAGTETAIRDIRVGSKILVNGAKQLLVESSLLELSLEGNFRYAQAAALVGRMSTELSLFLENDSAALDSYYTQKPPSTDSVRIRSRLLVKNLNPTLAFLGTGLAIDAGTSLQVALDFGAHDRLLLTGEAPRVVIDSTTAETVALYLQLDKTSDANAYVGQGLFETERVLLPSGFEFDEVALEPEIKNQRIDYTLLASTDAGRKDLVLAGDVLFLPNAIEGHIQDVNSRLLLNDSLWNFEPRSRFEYAEGRLFVQNVGIYNGEQRIHVEANIVPERRDSSGAIVQVPADDFLLSVEALQLSRVAELLSQEGEFSGRLDAEVRLKDLFGDPIPRVNGEVTDFVYRGFRYGDLQATSNWSASLNRLFSRVRLLRDDEALLTLEGYYDPKNADNPLSFSLTTRNLPLDLISPFTEGILSNLAGSITVDDIRVRGKLENPIVVGQATFTNVAFTVDYLKAHFAIVENRRGVMGRVPSGKIVFSELYGATVIDLRKLTFLDPAGGEADLSGTVYDIFGDLFLDLRFDRMENFRVMNTSSTDSDLFFGTAVVRRGSARVEGTADRVSLKAKVVTGAGTNVSIPISFYRKEERLPYVYFRQSAQEQLTDVRVAEDGPFALELEVEATEDAKLNLILDAQAGEVITGQGSGNITLVYGFTGDFEMFGTIAIARGEYLLNLQNVIKKNFTVRPGGTITWSGDPVEAQMRLTAVYRVNADIGSLSGAPTATAAQDGGAATNSATRADVNVLLNLEGSMLQPAISFKLDVPSAGSGQNENLTLTSQIRRIESDPGELNRQVFSLLIFARFAPQEGFFAGGGGASAASSVTELLSSQLNRWLGGAFGDDLNVEFSGQQFDQVKARVSANLFNDRVVVERNGTLVSGSNQDLTLGNLTIQIRLYPGTPDSNETPKENPGVLAVQVFRRENVGVGNTIASVNQGVGLFYRKDFDTFSELFGKRQKNTSAADEIEGTFDSTLFKKQIFFKTDSTQKQPLLLPGKDLPAPKPGGGGNAPVPETPAAKLPENDD